MIRIEEAKDVAKYLSGMANTILTSYPDLFEQGLAEGLQRASRIVLEDLAGEVDEEAETWPGV